MIDMASLQAAAGSLKVASDIARAILDLRDETKIRAKVMELQRAIIDAQSRFVQSATRTVSSRSCRSSIASSVGSWS